MYKKEKKSTGSGASTFCRTFCTCRGIESQPSRCVTFTIRSIFRILTNGWIKVKTVKLLSIVYVVEPMKPFTSYLQNSRIIAINCAIRFPLPVRRIVCVFLCSKKTKERQVAYSVKRKEKRKRKRRKKEWWKGTFDPAEPRVLPMFFC